MKARWLLFSIKRRKNTRDFIDDTNSGTVFVVLVEFNDGYTLQIRDTIIAFDYSNFISNFILSMQNSC